MLSVQLQTKRLLITAGTSLIGRAELDSRARLAEVLDAEVPSTWPPPLNDKGSMTFFTEYIEANPDAVGWAAWYFLLKSASGKPIVVGNGGFKGKPDVAGQVEMGYSIIEEFRGRGFATEAMTALVDWAFSHSDVTRIIVHTLPDLQPSIRVLEKCGFTYGGKGTEEGAIMYQLPRADFDRTPKISI